MWPRVLGMFLLCSACAIGVGNVPAREPVLPAPAAAIRRLELAAGILAEANRARRAERLEPLTADSGLDRAAMQYAAELAARRTLSHESPLPGRETLTKRVEAEGVLWQRVGENLANMSGGAATNIPRKSIELWLNSPGHRANLLNATYTHSGVGVAQDVNGSWYVVQIYLVPRPRR